MWYRATSVILTLSAAILVVAACALGYAFADNVLPEPRPEPAVPALFTRASQITMQTTTTLAGACRESTRFRCLGPCALSEFYREHPHIRGQLPRMLESVLRVKLADLLKQRLDARTVPRHAAVRRCVSKNGRSRCSSVALVLED